ncbi:ABC transporter permease [Tianweitania sp. BSSL-BM11]|uniref:ABC transporter permease n=1 Tax=Tianweitania aestuarii TaxID=2814886 RepID=A0ABS5RY80_9HYPH|nr:ABC transporter permease [Tianweitania aestuarii]MBS9722004.1 ABC transporter permease [Tianweitania aestuarii]
MSLSVTANDEGRRAGFAKRIAGFFRRYPEAFAALLILILCIGVGLLNPAFWQLANLFDILRGSVVRGLFALGVLMVLAAGGLDVSFSAIAALVMYAVTKAVTLFAPDTGMVLIFIMSAVGGALLGAINGVLVNALKAPSLIVTIGTQYAYRGFLLTFIGTALFMNIPPAMDHFGQWSLMSRTAENGFTVQLPGFVLVLAVAALATWAMLRFTLIGRAVYAVGGRPDIAERLGYRVSSVQLFVFAWAGMLAGVAGIIHVSSNRLANPFDLAGIELSVIAAVILGGARITGGSGSVLGTLLGVVLITLVSNVLILIGIPSAWQTAILGLFILSAGVFFVLQKRWS